jgi:hypothetical protein
MTSYRLSKTFCGHVDNLMEQMSWCVWDHQYSDFDSQSILKTESSNYLMTQQSISLIWWWHTLKYVFWHNLSHISLFFCLQTVFITVGVPHWSILLLVCIGTESGKWQHSTYNTCTVVTPCIVTPSTFHSRKFWIYNKSVWHVYVKLQIVYIFQLLHRCAKSLEPIGILIIFLIFIYRLKLKVKRLKMPLTLDERVEALHFGDSWRHRCMLLKSEIYVTLGRASQTVVLLSIPICWAKSTQTW